MASIRKKGKGGHYYARFYDSSRTLKRKEVPLRTTRKSIARKRLVELEEAFERGKYDPWAPEDRSEPITLDEAIQAFLAEKKERAYVPARSRGIAANWSTSSGITRRPGLCLRTWGRSTSGAT